MKILIIRDNNRMIRFRNRKLRTPVEIELSEKELIQMRIALKMAEIENFEVIDPNERKVEQDEVELQKIDTPPLIIEESKPSDNKSNEEPKSLLDKFMKESG
jgi:hypothetical protein